MTRSGDDSEYRQGSHFGDQSLSVFSWIYKHGQGLAIEVMIVCLLELRDSQAPVSRHVRCGCSDPGRPKFQRCETGIRYESTVHSAVLFTYTD